VIAAPSPQPVLPGYGPLPPPVPSPYAGPPRNQAEALAWFDAQPFVTQMQMPNPHVHPWFDAQGRALDSQGNLIVAAVNVDVPVNPPTTPEMAAARERLKGLIRSGNAYSSADVAAAGFGAQDAQWTSWFRQVRQGM
jgi:hypothetical protein